MKADFASMLPVPLWSHNSFVFHDGHHFRLGNHSGINSCPVLVRRLATLQVWARLIIVRILVRRWREGSRHCSYRRNIKEHVVGAIKLKKTQKIWHARLSIMVLWGISDATLLFFDVVTIQDLFVVTDIHICAQHWKEERNKKQGVLLMIEHPF